MYMSFGLLDKNGDVGVMLEKEHIKGHLVFFLSEGAGEVVLYSCFSL